MMESVGAKQEAQQEQVRELGHLPVLDGMRGVAIGLILLYHCFGTAFGFCWIGVDLFFVLSGFLITRILLTTVGNKGYFLNFFVRRMLRIFPLYYAVLLIVIFIFPFFFSDAGHRFVYLYSHQQWYWTYTENWLSLRDGFPPGNSIILSHFWSLAIEEQYYLFWPFLLFIFRGRKLVYAIIALICTALLLRCSGYFHNPGYYVSTITRMDSLLIGSLLAYLYLFQRGFLDRMIRYLLPVSAALILVAIVLSKEVHYSGLYIRTAGYTLLAVFFASLVHYALTNSAGIFSRVMRSAFLRTMGKYSYGLYVFHFPVYWLLREPVLRHFTDPDHPAFAAKMTLTGIALTVTTLLVLLSYHLMEQPLLRLKRYFN